jgi:hypothetical protein
MKRIVAAALGLVAIASAAEAQDDFVAVRKTPPVGKDLAAFPRLSGGGEVVRKINKVLGQSDRLARGSAKDCVGDGRGSWSRTVDMMRGPRNLSYVAHDDYFFAAPIRTPRR